MNSSYTYHIDSNFFHKKIVKSKIEVKFTLKAIIYCRSGDN